MSAAPPRRSDRLAGDLREKKVGELLSSAAEFGRSQPLAMLKPARPSSAFALSRVIKAGVAAPAASAAAEEPPPSHEPMKDLCSDC